MFLFKKRSERGQALIEAAIIFPLLVLFIGAISYFSQHLLVQQRLLMAARHGVWLMAIGSRQSVSNAQIESQVKDFLANGHPSFKEEKIRVTCDKAGILDIFNQPFDKVTVSYDLAVDPIMRPVLGCSEKTFSESCSVVGGTDYWGIF